MEISGLYIATLVVCVILSAIFSATETTLTTLSEAKTRQLIQEGHAGASSLKLWLMRPNRVLTTILVGNNVVNTLAAAIATVIAEQLFHSFAISIATAATTLIILVFGEISPKTFARHNAVALAPIVMTMLLPFYWLLFPVVIFLTWMATTLVRLVGGRITPGGLLATEEDITFMIRLGHQEGVLRREEGEMLESVIEFRDTIVREAMVPRTKISSFDKYATLDEVLSLVKANGHSRWPVYDENVDNIIGVFHTKDLLEVMQADQGHFSLTNYLRPALFVPDSMKIGNLLKEFQHGKAHLAIVVDEYGGTAGIISLEDVLEELVGEIRDEYDDEEEERVIRKLEDGSFLVDGRASIHDLGEALDVEFPEDELYDSLGGFLITNYGKMLPVGTQLEFHTWQFVVKQADEKRIMSVLVRKHPQSATDNDVDDNA